MEYIIVPQVNDDPASIYRQYLSRPCFAKNAYGFDDRVPGHCLTIVNTLCIALPNCHCFVCSDRSTYIYLLTLKKTN